MQKVNNLGHFSAGGLVVVMLSISLSAHAKQLNKICNLLLLGRKVISVGRQSMTADQVIKTLDLQPLPGEGGYFRETYRSSQRIPESANALISNRNFSTAIY